MKPGDGNFQTFGNGRNFVIHQIAFLPLNARNGSLVENDAFGGQPNRLAKPAACISSALPESARR